MRSSVKNILIFLTFVLIGAITMVFYLRRTAMSNITYSNPAPQDATATAVFSLETAPSETIIATITSLSGSVDWQSRTATEPAELFSARSIKQGETLLTKDDGHVLVALARDGIIELSPNTELEFVQLLPMNMVFKQNHGTVSYTIRGTYPLTVRAGSLLTYFSNASLVLSFDEDTSRIAVSSASGSATLAYNDVDYQSHRLSLPEKEKIIFDNAAKRIITRSYSEP